MPYKATTSEHNGGPPNAHKRYILCFINIVKTSIQIKVVKSLRLFWFINFQSKGFIN